MPTKNRNFDKTELAELDRLLLKLQADAYFSDDDRTAEVETENFVLQLECPGGGVVRMLGWRSKR